MKRSDSRTGNPVKNFKSKPKWHSHRDGAHPAGNTRRTPGTLTRSLVSETSSAKSMNDSDASFVNSSSKWRIVKLQWWRAKRQWWRRRQWCEFKWRWITSLYIAIPFMLLATSSLGFSCVTLYCAFNYCVVIIIIIM